MDITNYFDVRVHSSRDSRENQLISQRHSPETTEDFLDNLEAINEIDNWFKDHSKRGLFVYGPSGTGKTCLIDIMCKKYGLNVFTTSSINKRKNDLFELHGTVKNFTTKGVFVLDEMETVVNRSDNISIHELSKLVSEKYIRVIYICNLISVNKMTSIISQCTGVELTYPGFDTLLNRCTSIMNKEGIPVTQSSLGNLRTLLRCSQCEPRYVFDSIGLLNVSNFVSVSRDNDIDIYAAYDILIDEDAPLETKIKSFLTDTGTIPILFQENYIDNGSSLLEQVHISESMSVADTFHKSMFNQTSSVVFEMYGVFSSIFLCKSVQKRKPRFGLLWTKQSAMFQKRKYVKNIERELQLGTIDTTLLCDMNDVFKDSFNKWASKMKNKRKVDMSLSSDPIVTSFYNLLQCYNIYDKPLLMYELSNVVNFNKSRDFTKKTFMAYMEHFYQLHRDKKDYLKNRGE